MKHALSVLLVHFVAAIGLSADNLQTYERVIRATPLPTGYELVTQEARDGDRLVSRLLIVAKEGARSHVIVTIENRELPTDGHRRAAAKGYVNGTAKSFTGAGFQIVARELPDIDNADLSKPVVTKLTLENGGGETSFREMRAILKNVGYNVVTFATSPDDRKLLTDWANSVVPLE